MLDRANQETGYLPLHWVLGLSRERLRKEVENFEETMVVVVEDRDKGEATKAVSQVLQ